MVFLLSLFPKNQSRATASSIRILSTARLMNYRRKYPPHSTAAWQVGTTTIVTTGRQQEQEARRQVNGEVSDLDGLLVSLSLMDELIFTLPNSPSFTAPESHNHP